MSHPILRGIGGLVALVLALALGGCTSGATAIVRTFSEVISGGDAAANAPINPSLRYLRAVLDGRTALLVLGYVDADARGPIEVWYSAEREVLRLQNGRLVGAAGLTTEWRNVEVPELPAWAAMTHAARAGAPLGWTRVRDVMPGYRFGLRDALLLRETQPPARHGLLGVDPARLTWFEEAVEAGSAESLPLARYAVDFSGGREVVVYGEQCIAPTLCFSWQRWPVGK